MAQWVKVGNIRGPAGEIPDVSDYLKIGDGNTVVDGDGTTIRRLRLPGTNEETSSISAHNDIGDTYIESQLIADISYQQSAFQARALNDTGDNATVRASAGVNGNSSLNLTYEDKQTGTKKQLAFGLTGTSPNKTSAIASSTYPIDQIWAEDISNPNTAPGKRVPNLNTVKSMISGMVKATTDEEHGTGASLLTSDGKVVDSVVFPGTDESYTIVNSKLFCTTKNDNIVGLGLDENDNPYFEINDDRVNYIIKSLDESYSGDDSLPTAKAVTDYVSGYLPKTGGTLTGNVDLNTGTAEPNISIKRTVDGGTTAVEGRLRIDSDGVVGLRSIVGGTTVNNLYLEQTQTRFTKPLSVASGGVPQDGTVGQILKKGQNGAEWVDSIVVDATVADVAARESVAVVDDPANPTSGIVLKTDETTNKTIITGIGDKKVDEIHISDLDSTATDDRVVNKKYVDDAIEAIPEPDMTDVVKYSSNEFLKVGDERVDNLTITSNAAVSLIQLLTTSPMSFGDTDYIGININSMYNDEGLFIGVPLKRYAKPIIDFGGKTINAITDNASTGDTNALVTAKAVKDAVDAINIPDTSSMLALNSANNLTKNGEEVRNLSVVKDGYNGLTLTTGGTNGANQLLLQTFANDGANYGQFHVDTAPSAVNFYMATEGATLGLYCDAHGSSVGTTENPAGKVFVKDITDTETADGDLAVNLRTLKTMLPTDTVSYDTDARELSYGSDTIREIRTKNPTSNEYAYIREDNTDGYGGAVGAYAGSDNKIEMRAWYDNVLFTMGNKSVSNITDSSLLISSGSATALVTAKAVKDYTSDLVSYVTDEQIDEYLEYDPSVTIPFDLINNDMGTCSCSIDETGTVSVFGGTISWGSNLNTAYNTWATIPDVTVPAAYRPTSDTIFDSAANSGSTYWYDVRFNTDGTIDIRRNNCPSYPASYITTIAISGKHTYQSTPPAQEGAPDLGNGIMTAEQVLSRIGSGSGGGSVEKLFEGTATTKSVPDDYTIFVLQLFGSSCTTIQVFPRYTARYTIPHPTYSGTYVESDILDVIWTSSEQTVTFQSGSTIELIYGIK